MSISTVAEPAIMPKPSKVEVKITIDVGISNELGVRTCDAVEIIG